MAVLVNPADATNAESQSRAVEAAARTLGLHLQFLRATSSHEIDAAFAPFVRERPEALFVGSGAFFLSRTGPIGPPGDAVRASRGIFVARLCRSGRVLSYGATIAEAYHQVGVYTGRILKGVNPAELPVVQSAKFELAINHQTARHSASLFRRRCSPAPTR